jgi:hypothetical protein
VLILGSSGDGSGEAGATGAESGEATGDGGGTLGSSRRVGASPEGLSGLGRAGSARAALSGPSPIVLCVFSTSALRDSCVAVDEGGADVGGVSGGGEDSIGD